MGFKLLVYILIAFRMKNGYFHIEMISAAHMLGGMLPARKFEKMCNFVRLGVYFDQILH